jgi:hypothetical protein
MAENKEVYVIVEATDEGVVNRAVMETRESAEQVCREMSEIYDGSSFGIQVYNLGEPPAELRKYPVVLRHSELRCGQETQFMDLSHLDEATVRALQEFLQNICPELEVVETEAP